MNKHILNIEVQDFINKNLDSDLIKLILKGSPFKTVEIAAIVKQIEAKKRCKKKLPTWFNSKKIYYPNKINIEQSSSEKTAQYKAKLIEGNSIIDLTGGFGVDCYYFSKQFNNVIHCELNKELSELVTLNYQQLKVTNIKTVSEDGLAFLNNNTTLFDWIYIDPSRRHDKKGKVFFLNDCLPNVPLHLKELFNKSKNIMIKTSPLLDISVGLKELEHIKTMHIVAVNNDVKELLWCLEKDYTSDITIRTINLKDKKNEVFDFKLSEESIVQVSYGKPLTYLYEPNASILKSGAFHTIAHTLKLVKLHKHSHLYTSDKLIDFPGRCFKIEKQIAYSKKLLKKESFTNANITTRNFPESVEQLRKKYHIKDGGPIYLFFTTDNSNSKIVLICSKVT